MTTIFGTPAIIGPGGGMLIVATVAFAAGFVWGRVYQRSSMRSQRAPAHPPSLEGDPT